MSRSIRIHISRLVSSFPLFVFICFCGSMTPTFSIKVFVKFTDKNKMTTPTAYRSFQFQNKCPHFWNFLVAFIHTGKSRICIINHWCCSAKGLNSYYNSASSMYLFMARDFNSRSEKAAVTSYGTFFATKTHIFLRYNKPPFQIWLISNGKDYNKTNHTI